MSLFANTNKGTGTTTGGTGLINANPTIDQQQAQYDQDVHKVIENFYASYMYFCFAKNN